MEESVRQGGGCEVCSRVCVKRVYVRCVVGYV